MYARLIAVIGNPYVSTGVNLLAGVIWMFLAIMEPESTGFNLLMAVMFFSIAALVTRIAPTKPEETDGPTS